MMKKILILITKTFGILLGIIAIVMLIWFTYANLFLTIDEERAWAIAREVIHEKYEDMCNGGFKENLTLKKYTHNGIYDFSADSRNGNCNVTIFMGKFGEYDSWIGVK